MPREHRWATRKSVAADELKRETMVLLGAGPLLPRPCAGGLPRAGPLPAGADGTQQSFEGSSLETIRQMVASGIGVTVLPSSSVPAKTPRDSLLAYVPFARPVPDRRVVLVYRKTFPRLQAIETLRQAVLACSLNGVKAVAH